MDAPAETVAAARRLRREMTLPEVVLWNAIRGGRVNGFRFRRQHPIGPYVLDFYCVAAKLAVELDGSAHDLPDGLRRDGRRDAWLAELGVRVLRIPARDVLERPGDVWRTIEAALA